MNDSESNRSMFERADPSPPVAGTIEVFAAWSPTQIAGCHSSLQRLFEYWNTRRGARSMPARGDVDPIDLKPLLPQLILIDVVPDPRRYVYRLVGTHEVEMRGGESAEDTTYYLDRVVRTRQPVLYRGTYQPLSTRTQREDVIFLPLSKDGEAVKMIMIFGHVDWVKEETRP